MTFLLLNSSLVQLWIDRNAGCRGTRLCKRQCPAVAVGLALIHPIDAAAQVFNREQETELLQAILKLPPRKVLVMVGPKAAGKTKLIKSIRSKMGPERVVYMDAR